MSLRLIADDAWQVLSSLFAVAHDFDRNNAVANGIDGESASERDGSPATVPEPDRLETWQRVKALSRPVENGPSSRRLKVDPSGERPPAGGRWPALS
jgi:hypothetical protein